MLLFVDITGPRLGITQIAPVIALLTLCVQTNKDTVWCLAYSLEFFTNHEYITNSQRDQLPVSFKPEFFPALISQLVNYLCYAVINHAFVSFPVVQMYDVSYIHLQVTSCPLKSFFFCKISLLELIVKHRHDRTVFHCYLFFNTTVFLIQWSTVRRPLRSYEFISDDCQALDVKR